MAICSGNKRVGKLHIGSKEVRAVYAGPVQVWSNIVRVEHGEDYSAWSYDDPVRRRTVTPWEQDIHYDGSAGERRTGTPYTQEETARTSVDWDGSAYWNGSCGADYHYVDYQKVRTCYSYSDGVVRYSDYCNGDARSRRIEGQCGWTREWRITRDWYRTGSTCNSAGVNGAYDCDGTYSVTYWNEGQDQSYCFPDMSGSTETRTLWRVGPVATKIQVDGQCGYKFPRYKLNVGLRSWSLGTTDHDVDDSTRDPDETLRITTVRNYIDNRSGANLFLYDIVLVDPNGNTSSIAPNSLSFEHKGAAVLNCRVDMRQFNNKNAEIVFTADKIMAASYSGIVTITHTSGARILLQIYVSFCGERFSGGATKELADTEVEDLDSRLMDRNPKI